MEDSREVSGLTEIQTRNAKSKVNKRHVYPVAVSWLLHEQSSTNFR